MFLTGVDGWYDLRAGRAGMTIELTDYQAIEELRGRMWHERVPLLQRFADQQALVFGHALQSHMEKHRDAKEVIVLTHVPPFPEASWHQGKPSDPTWLPVMTSRALGEELRGIAEYFQGTQFWVLCGHTHSPGLYEPASHPNLHVLTGSSEYGDPHLAGVLTYDTEGGFQSTKLYLPADGGRL